MRRSYSPSPPRGYGRRGRSPSPWVCSYSGSRGRDLPTSLLVRNLHHDCRPEDLRRRPFGHFGPLKDVYVPRDYYSGEDLKEIGFDYILKISSLEEFQVILILTLSRSAAGTSGFGFVQFVDPDDAAEAKYEMDGQILLGRQLTVVFAEENRKKPSDMRARERRGGSDRSSHRRRSTSRYSRSPPPPWYVRSRSHSRDYSPPPKRRYHSRSVSPREKRRYRRERSYSRSLVRERSPSYDGSRSRSRSPVRVRERSASNNGSRSPSPVREQSPIRGASRSRSPIPRDSDSLSQ